MKSGWYYATDLVETISNVLPCTRSHAKRLLRQKAVEVDGSVVDIDHASILLTAEQMPSRHRLRIGKHTFVEVVIDEE